MVTILTQDRETQLDVQPSEALWLSNSQVEQATGWQMKSEGFCKDDICVPIPRNDASEYQRGDTVNLSYLWNFMHKPCVASQAGDVWFLGDSAQQRNDALLSLAAPDFTLPDFTGKLHSLTDFRRQRVLLITWASW